MPHDVASGTGFGGAGAADCAALILSYLISQSLYLISSPHYARTGFIITPCIMRDLQLEVSEPTTHAGDASETAAPITCAALILSCHVMQWLWIVLCCIGGHLISPRRAGMMCNHLLPSLSGSLARFPGEDCLIQMQGNINYRFMHACLPFGSLGSCFLYFCLLY